MWDEPRNALIIPAWIRKRSSRGKAYYVNVITGETAWRKPAGFVSGPHSSFT